MNQPTNAEAMVKLWQESGTGIGVYVRLPNGNEPVYMGGMVEKFASSSTIEIAIRWLTQLKYEAIMQEQGVSYVKVGTVGMDQATPVPPGCDEA